MPILNIENVPIPVIDISNEDPHTGDELVDAVAKWGFVFVRGEGVGFTTKDIETAFQLSRQLFQSPVEEKKQCAISPDNKGWSSPRSEVLDTKSQEARNGSGDFKDKFGHLDINKYSRAFNFGDFTIDGKAQQILPKSLLSHEDDISQFATLCRKLCIKLLRHFARGLRIDASEGGEEWFTPRHDLSKGISGSILRFLYYPAIQKDNGHDPEADIRAGAHSDYGSLTLLFQRPSQTGLEILTPSQTWSPVPVSPKGSESDEFPPILVNIGDLLNYWTDGLLKSTVHRVVMRKDRGEDRYSIAYFCHPVNDTELVRIPSELISSMRNFEENLNAAKRVMTAAEHLKTRLAATYGWAH